MRTRGRAEYLVVGGAAEGRPTRRCRHRGPGPGALDSAGTGLTAGRPRHQRLSQCRTLEAETESIRRVVVEPILFIGSSTEGRTIVDAMYAVMRGWELVPRPWTNGVFEASRTWLAEGGGACPATTSFSS